MDRIPVLRMGSLLLITIQVDMHDKLALHLQDEVTKRIADCGSTGVLIHISSLEIVDWFIGTNAREHRGPCRRSGRGDRGSRNAARGRHHPRRTGDVISGCANRPECGSGNGIALRRGWRNAFWIRG